MGICNKCGKAISYRLGNLCMKCRYENKHSAPSIQEKIRPKQPKTCPQCGKQFFASRCDQIYCSHNCGMRANYARRKAERPAKLCEACGKPLPEGRRKYYSEECACIAPGRKDSLPIDDRVCVICGKTFTPPTRRRKDTCSPECSKALQLENNRKYKERKRGKAAPHEETAKMQPLPLPSQERMVNNAPASIRPGYVLHMEPATEKPIWTGEIGRKAPGGGKARIRIPVNRLPDRGSPTKDAAARKDGIVNAKLEQFFESMERRRGRL